MLSVEITGTTDPTRRTLHAAGDLAINVQQIVDLAKPAAGTMTVELALEDGKSLRMSDAIQPWRRVWWVLDDGEPIYNGFLKDRPTHDNEANALRLTLARGDCLLAARRFWSTLSFTGADGGGVDQHHIAGDLIRYATGRPVQHVDATYAPAVQTLPGAFLPWLLIDEQPSGVKRVRGDNGDGYQGVVGKVVSEALAQLCAVDDVEGGARAAQGIPGAFDYRPTYGRDDDGHLFMAIELGYPKAGRDDPLYVGFPGTISRFHEGADASESASGWRTISESGGLPGEPQYDVDAFAAGWPLVQRQDSVPSTEKDKLEAHAESMLRKYRGDNQGWRYDLSPQQWRKFQLCDVITPSILFPLRWPGLLGPPRQRIVGQTLTFDAGELSALAPMLEDLR